jgi:C4-dicarboxylate-specific signal transduction histidine kinase
MSLRAMCLLLFGPARRYSRGMGVFQTPSFAGAMRAPVGRRHGWTQYLLVLGLWLALVAFMWFFVIASTREIAATAEKQARDQAQVYTGLIDSFVSQTLYNFDQDILLLRDAFDSGDLGPDINRWRETNYARNAIAVRYAIIDSQGRLAAVSGDQLKVGADLSDRPHFRFHKATPEDRPFLSVPEADAASERPSMQLSRRISAPDGSFLGVVSVTLDAGYYDQFLDRTRMRAQDVIGLIGRDGGIRLRSGPVALPGNTYSGYPVFERMLRERTGTGRGRGISDGIERFYAFTTLDAYDLIVYVAVAPESDSPVLKSGVAFLSRVAWGTTFLTGLSALGIVFVLKRRHEATTTRAVVDELSRRMSIIGGLLDRSDALLLAVDRTGRIRFANERATAFFARTAAEDADDLRQAFRFPAPGAAELFHERVRASSDAPVSFEQDVLDPRGVPHSFLWVWSADERGGDDVPSLIGFGIDVTDRRRSEMMAIRSDKISSLGEIAASIVHELNQPLNVIGLACSNARQQIAADGDREATLARIGRIEKQVARAAGILDRLRRYIAGSPTDYRARFSVAEAVRAAEEFVADQLRIDGIRVDVRVDPDASVRGDRLLFEQLLVNLLLNARDAIVSVPAAAETGWRGTVAIEGAPDAAAGVVRIAVEDTGPGLSEEAVARAFEPFYTTKAAGRGTGLGLPICRTIVQSFGGEISIRNGSRGARVEFTMRADDARATALAGAAQ